MTADAHLSWEDALRNRRRVLWLLIAGVVAIASIGVVAFLAPKLFESIRAHVFWYWLFPCSAIVVKDAEIPVNARWIMMATLVFALGYLIRTMLLVFGIHGRVIRSTPDPSDLPTPPGGAKTSPYDRALACKTMRYTIANYRADNEQVDALFVAQGAFRNAIVAVAIGGSIAGMMTFLGTIAKNGQRNSELVELRNSVDDIVAALKCEKPVSDIAAALGGIRQSLEEIHATLTKRSGVPGCSDPIPSQAPVR